jgi:hypothetical protein
MNNEFSSMIAAVSLTAARCVEIARSVQDRQFKGLGVSFLRILSVKSDERRRVHSDMQRDCVRSRGHSAIPQISTFVRHLDQAFERGPGEAG